VLDGVAIVVCATATLAAWPALGTLALVAPYVLGHFFLFCNVYRISRTLELVWSAVFIADFTAWWQLAGADVAPALLSQLPVTVIVLVLGLRRRAPAG